MENENKKESKKMIITRIAGDITRIKCDAIMTAINSAGAWFGGIDKAIYNVAGVTYHGQIKREDLYELNAIVTKGDHNNHKGKFDNVIFVVDDLENPLRAVIASGLEAANNAGFKTLAIPSIRTGVMKKLVERELEDVVSEYFEGVKIFLNSIEKPNIEAIAFVTHCNPELDELIHNALKKEGW